MRKLFLTTAFLVAAAALVAPSAWAGNPHFVTLDVVREGDSLVVTFKEAGLGNEDQVHIVVTATAACVNPGSKKPQAENKQSVSTAGDFPVQNGKAEGTLTLTPSFKPPCSPPMTVEFSNVTVTDTTSGISKKFPGIF